MIEQTAKVNSLVDLLTRYEPQKLEDLRQTYPEQNEILSPGLTLGKRKSNSKVLVDLSEESIVVLKERVAENTRYLKKRINTARKVRLISSLLAAISTAGILTLLGWERYLAIVTLICTLASLASEHIESSSLYGEEKNPRLLLERLFSLRVDIENLQGRLRLTRIIGHREEDLIDTVQKTNDLAAKVIEIEERLGIAYFET